MKKVLLFGSTGNVGKKIAAELLNRGYNVTAVVRSEQKKNKMDGLAPHCLVVDVLNKVQLKEICTGFDIVVSALGKSVSLTDRSKPTFQEVDLEANSSILQEALNAGVRKFVYVSAFHAENYTHLEYFRVHHAFSEKLKASGLDYAIVKPPAVFSAFLDLIEMARKGQVVTLGKGDKKTNPIYEGDLAKVCADAIHQPNVEIAAGGKEILTRHEINELIQQTVNPARKVRKLPAGLAKALLPLIRLGSRNLYDKMAFFMEVMQHDTIAPQVGETKLAEYIRQKMVNRASESQLT
jgi:uncharacterized protein YbjT (DUF2867 family)